VGGGWLAPLPKAEWVGLRQAVNTDLNLTHFEPSHRSKSDRPSRRPWYHLPALPGAGFTDPHG
jgi:hypothetical protein